MKFLLFSLPGCYPCERANKVLRDHFSHIPISNKHYKGVIGRWYGIQTSPTLVIVTDEGDLVGKLVGAHAITKIEVQGLISDFLSC